MPSDKSNLEITIPLGSAGERLDRALAAAVPELSRERLKALLKEGAVTGASGPERSASRKVQVGERFHIAIPAPTPARARPQDIPLTVVYEDDDLIVIDKPAGLVVHPAAGNPDGTLVNALLHHCGGTLSGIGGVSRPGIVHRIDKNTSGLLVAAKTEPTHMALAAQFAAHSVGRFYAAITRDRPVPPAGRIEGNIGRSPKNRKKMAVLEDGRGKHAVTHYRTIQPLRNAALIECRLETGRTHQVRVHLSAKGFPLLGDPLYGGKGGGSQGKLLSALRFERQALHAKSLQFEHPSSKEILSFESPLPRDMQELVAALSVH
ncbi:RluA family pseudouridine synthase [Pacificimonas sp. WHA3]|uniref:Pseudouridine synthase n=1 Tax=Pacificimonas pallii TaxID=2827236 RepID=A0ABS6SB71_9SPHN|nr:RluA family pseudouridine synthase [Pacificimonas pallii]MBV7255176.1 RluA family pseudouridine synthase [Pacificimonas pallii]